MLRLTLVALLLLSGCSTMFDDTKSFKGRYLQNARLVLDPDPNALRPSTFEAGPNWIFWLDGHRGGGGPLSETATRATVFIEFVAQPAIGEVVDLAVAPLQLTYESGGQKIEYISRTAAGTLVLRPGQGDSLVAELDVTFTSPVLGTGEKRLSGEIRLDRFTSF